jgi:SAM-dependent methyltransferase
MSNDRPQSHAAAQEFFDQIAQDYTARSQTMVYNVSSLSFSRRQDVVTRLMLATPKGGTVLDYGMGPAVFGPAAVQNGLRYVGLDISPKMVELARGMNLPNAEFHLGDLNVLERFKGSADTILLIGLIDYLEQPAEGLQQLARCVKPGGRIILSFRNHRSVPRLLRNTAKSIWRRLKGASLKERTAFAAPVLENSFVPHRDFIPLLRAEGFTRFDINYLDCSPIFFNLGLPKPVWKFWKRADAALSGPATAWMCASGVLMAHGKR